MSKEQIGQAIDHSIEALDNAASGCAWSVIDAVTLKPVWRAVANSEVFPLAALASPAAKHVIPRVIYNVAVIEAIRLCGELAANTPAQ